MSADCDGAVSIPTLLVDLPASLTSWKGCPAADWALAYFKLNGFEGDRVRMNCSGYPGLLRELDAPPPWAELEAEECIGEVSPEREIALRPLIVQAHDIGVESLVHEHESWREESRRRRRFLRAIYEGAETIAEIAENPAEQAMEAFVTEAFATLLNLAASLTGMQFEACCNAVFDFDEFSVAPGAPDLLVWLPRAEPPCWFFSEVKAPGDYMSLAQEDWLRNHWELVRGHYLLTKLACPKSNAD